MKIERSFKIALNIILHSRLRSWLTILGIVIGIAAIVSIVSVEQGAQRSIEQNLNSLNANIITITPEFSRAAGAGAEFRGGFGGGGGFGEGGASSTAKAPKNLTSRDVIAIEGTPNIQVATGIISGSITNNVTFLSKTATVSIEGVDTSVWKNIESVSLASGRYLIQGDAGVVVIGARIANSTFSGIEVNRQISIKGRTFKIVGILQQSGTSDDSRIFMPISEAVNILDNKYAGDFDSIIVKLSDISLTNDTIAQITNKLMLSHGILQASKQDFSVISPTQIQARISSTLSSASLFLTAIAVISLIVGAIGIMNSMFTSVLEKTKEIGILKALGAKNRDILTIFLFNSGIIGLIGGSFGVLLGIIGSGFIGQLAGGATSIGGRFSLAYSFISPVLIVEVFVLSIIVGLAAGAIPAYRASKLEPVDALRYE